MRLYSSDLISYLGTVIDYCNYMKKLFVLVLLFCAVNSINGQLNDYKYIVVPVKFKAFKNPNQFQTSTLIKHFMTVEGFNVIYDNALPFELQENRCLALFTDLLDESGLFKTKVALVLKDCKGEVIYRTLDAQTKIKELDKAYKTVITETCASFQGLNHNYEPNSADSEKETIAVSFKNDVKSIEEKDAINEEKRSSAQPIKEEIVEKVMQKTDVVKDSNDDTTEKIYLYAEALGSGYKLSDKDGAIKYILGETSIENVFLVNQEGVNGVVVKKDEKWYLEYKGATGKIVEELDIKF